MIIRTRTKFGKFRRCGVVHTDQWTEYADGRFTPEEIARLQAEPMLQVECCAGSETISEVKAVKKGSK